MRCAVCGLRGCLGRWLINIRGDLIKLEAFDKLIKGCREKSTKNGSYPVDPMVAGKATLGDDGRTK